MPRPTNPRNPNRLLPLPQVRQESSETVGQVVPLFVEPKGIDRYHASSRIGNDHAVKMRNFMFDDGVLVSRLGTDLMGGEAASEVLQVVDLVRKGQKKVTIRFCTRHLEIFEYGTGSWRSFALPLTGTNRDLFAYTGWADKLLFSNGVDGLWEFDFRSLEAKIVPGAPGAKHLTTFGRRVVATSTIENGEDHPLRVRWSANRDYTKWETEGVTPDLAGGYEDLYGSSGGATDESMAVIPYSDEQAWLVRSRSTHQMSVSGNVLAPFRFSEILSSVGSPFRHSIVALPGGVIFASRDNVHVLTSSSNQQIGDFVIDEIIDEVESLRNCYATYDVGRQEYRLAANNLVWRYRFQEKAWTLDEYPWMIRSLSRQIQGFAGIPIDSLPGIIDDLTGAINDLVYFRDFDDAMMFVAKEASLTFRETDDTQDVLLTGDPTDSELLLETGVLNLEALAAVELLEAHLEYESGTDQELLFEVTFDDGEAWQPYSRQDVEETAGSEVMFLKSERVSRKLRLRLRSQTLGKLRLLGLAPVVVRVNRAMAPRRPKPARIEVTPASLALAVGATQQLTFRVLDAGNNPLSGLAVTVISTNNAVATVSNTGIVRAIAPGSFAIVASVRNVQVSVSGTVVSSQAAVAEVVVTPAIAQGVAGSSQQFTATTKDSSGNVITGRSITWGSSNNAVATVNSSGLVTLIAAGTVAISATSEGISGGATLTVTASAAVVASVTVTPNPFAGDVGDVEQLVATVKDASLNVLVGKVITWGTSNPAVATVNASGLVTMVGAGSVTITATCETVPGTSAGTVTALPVPVNTVLISPAGFSIVAGSTQALTITLKDALNNILTGRVITYSSSNTAVATVSSLGVVTGLAAGSATITATSEGKSSSVTATVTAVPVATVTVSPGAFSLAEGQSQQLVATAYDSLGNVLPGRPFTWGTSNPTVATVNSTGLVTVLSDGTATITATCETKIGSASLTATDVVPPMSLARLLGPLPNWNNARASSPLVRDYLDLWAVKDDLQYSLYGVDWVQLYYYDRAKINYSMNAINGIPARRVHADEQAVNYRDGYVLPNFGALPAHWMMSTGLAANYLVTGSSLSKTAVGYMADVMCGLAYRDQIGNTPAEGNIDCRVQAYYIKTILDAHAIGALSVGVPSLGLPGGYDWPTELRRALDEILAARDGSPTWRYKVTAGDPILPDGTRITHPFTVGLLWEQLARYYSIFEPDPRIPVALKESVDYARVNDYDVAGKSFYYFPANTTDDGNPASGRGLSYDLNIICGRGVAFVYKTTGQLSYKTWYMDLLDGAKVHGWFDGQKQLNQLFTSLLAALADLGL
jgi:uncharacterized protein YjdB